MPITVKLSEHFYRKFGHEVVDEMVNWFNQVDDTYRSELRELNELNFARFDAKLEQRVTQSEARLGQRLTEVKAELRQELAQLRTDIADLRGDLRADLQAQGKTLIRWMFVFWTTTLTTLGGLVVLVLRSIRLG